jgi:RNA-binding protein with serine-rich domain 1
MEVDSSKSTKGDLKPDAKVIVINNLTRNVVESHLRTIFGFYGDIVKIDVPLFGKCMFPIQVA